MLKFDHLRLPVSNLTRSRRWYLDTRTLALQDDEGFTIFLQEAGSAVQPHGCALWFQVVDVDATFAEWSARGIEFSHGRRKSYWGYGAELKDPDGYLVRLWNERSMKEK